MNTLQVRRVNLFFTPAQIEALDKEARRRTLSRASLVRELVQNFLDRKKESMEGRNHD
jgi:hypothetical protein